MKAITLDRFGQLVEAGVIGFGALWVLWAAVSTF
jgi:hypothetical protein